VGGDGSSPRKRLLAIIAAGSSHSRAAFIPAILLVFGMGSSLVACGGASASKPSSPSLSSGGGSTLTTGAPQTGQASTANAGVARTYLVGTDIPAGLYKGEVTSTAGYWQISTDAGGANVLANADVTGPFYVQVQDGQYIELKGVKLAKVSPTQASTPTAIAAGTYLVGTDIPAGLYKGKTTGNPGYWQISGDANGTTVLANADVTGPFYVQVKKGQYLQLSGVELSPAAPATIAPTITTVSDGTYLVGTDIPAGRYKGMTMGGWGSWRISSDANGSHVLAGSDVSGAFTLAVKDGQFLDLANARIGLVN
jgi:hypothetical protein